MQVTTALIYGGIYSFGDGQSSVGDRLGLCSLVAIGNTNLAMAGMYVWVWVWVWVWVGGCVGGCVGVGGSHTHQLLN